METDSCSFVFMPPRSFSYEKLKEELGQIEKAISNLEGDITFVDKPPRVAELEQIEEDQEISDLIENRFEYNVKSAMAKPMKPWEIFLMNTDEYASYILLISQKVLNRFIDNGILIIESEDVHGCVYLGEEGEPNVIFAEVFSKNNNIGQGIYVKAKNKGHEVKKDLVLLLSSYRYTIESVPDDSELRASLLESLGNHVKFERTR